MAKEIERCLRGNILFSLVPQFVCVIDDALNEPGNVVTSFACRVDHVVSGVPTIWCDGARN